MDEKFRKRSDEVVSWLVDRGYKEDFIREQIVCASSIDRDFLTRKVDVVTRERTRFH